VEIKCRVCNRDNGAAATKKKKNKTIDTLSKPPEFLFSFDEDIKSRRAKSAFPPRF
jgi:hypothetical protein